MIKKVIDELMGAIEYIIDEPYARFMKSEGCDPRDGWVLCVPESLRPEMSKYPLPSYIKFVHGTEAFFMMTKIKDVKNDEQSNWVTTDLNIRIKKPLIINTEAV